MIVGDDDRNMNRNYQWRSINEEQYHWHVPNRLFADDDRIDIDAESSKGDRYALCSSTDSVRKSVPTLRIKEGKYFRIAPISILNWKASTFGIKTEFPICIVHDIHIWDILGHLNPYIGESWESLCG